MRLQMLFMVAIGVAFVACSRSQTEPVAPERTFDPRPVAADLVGAWEGPRGKLAFDGETLRATEYWCGRTKPTTPQFAEDSSCAAFNWELPYQLEGHHLDVTHPSGQVNRYTLFVDPDGRIYIHTGKGFSVLPHRRGVGHFGEVGAIRLDVEPCLYVDIFKEEHPADCRWEERDGRTWLHFNETFMHKKVPWTLAYLEDLGLLVTTEHLEAVFRRVSEP